MRRLERYPVSGPNALWQIYRTVSVWKGVRNFVVIQISRYLPSFRLKNWLYRRVLGMRVGRHTAFALMAMPDVFFPERIEIGDNSIVGYHTTILAHEYLVGEYRLGDVRIGSHVMIGANCTILPGVTIGDHAVVAAGTVVHRDVPAYAMVGGNPMRILRADVRVAKAGTEDGSGGSGEAGGRPDAAARRDGLDL